MRFVEIAETKAALGLRLVIAGKVPSPWSQAAMGIFDMKGIDYLAVRLRPAAEAVANRSLPMPEPVRHAFEVLDKAVRDAVPTSLLRHRDRKYERHLPLPIRF